MKKNQQNQYICTQCNAQFPKWSGRCLSCEAWSSIKKIEINQPAQKSRTEIKIIQTDKEKSVDDKTRMSTSIQEIDQVLGGGIVPGSLILLGGEPGIGKSTIVLQIAQAISNTFYVSGEESDQQIQMRLSRLKSTKSIMQFFTDNNVEQIIYQITTKKPPLVIVDSIQTIYSSDVEQSPGSVTQVRTCTNKLLETAKQYNIPIIIIGHVTKDGQVAGPKTLEHLVDVVLYLEGDSNQYFRMLRGAKNRFGSTNEIGVFEMTGSGLEVVKNPSAHFIENTDQTIPGSIVTVINEGKRCFLVEVQSLVNKTIFGMPVRKTSGYDNNRLQLLLAVLTKRLNLNFGQFDVYLNIIGGLKIKEVSIDLAICMSLISAYKDKVLDKNIVAIGEVGLGGEVRPIPFLEKRIIEATKLGFKKIYIPKLKKKPKADIQLIEVANIKDLIKK